MSWRRLRPRFTLLTPVALVGLAASVTLIVRGSHLLGPLTLVGVLVWLIEDQRQTAELEARGPCRSCGGRGWRPAAEGQLAPRVCPRCNGVNARPLDGAAIRDLPEADLDLVELIAAQGGAAYDVVLFARLGSGSHRQREAIDARLEALTAVGLLDQHWRELRGDKPLDAGQMYVARPEQLEAVARERARRAQALLPGNRSRLSPLAGERQ